MHTEQVNSRIEWEATDLAKDLHYEPH